MGILKRLFGKSDNEIEFEIGPNFSKKLEHLRKEREYYKNELEEEKNKPKKSIIRIWDLETKLDDIEELIMKELKK